MNIQEDFVFWRLAYLFIHDHGYRVIQLFENQRELWLEKLENKSVPVIRLLRQDLNWSNTMQRDIELVALNGEKIRKQLVRGDLNVLNIYVSAYPPVDDYEFRINKPFTFGESNKTFVHTVVLSNQEYQDGFQKLSVFTGSDVSFPIQGEYQLEEVATVKKAALEHAVKVVKAERDIFNYGKPIFTYIFLAVQIAIFLFLEANGGSTNSATLIKYGAKFNPLILEGEWWRFITPIFLHIGFLHLAMNSLALYYLGTTVERLFGSTRFVFIYLAAGFFGSVASFIFSGDISAGASGAIFGCFGALLYFGTIFPKLFFRTMGMNVFILLAVNLAFGFSASGIDNAGHLGGLAGGFLATGIVHFPKKKKVALQLLFLLITAAIAVGSLKYGFSGKARASSENSIFILAQEYVKKGNYEKAYKELKKIDNQTNHPSGKTYFLLSYTEIKKGMFPEAKAHLLKTIKLEPDFHEAYYNLALISLEENNWVQAKKYAERAADLKPGNKDYLNLVKKINEHLQSPGGGV